MGGKGGYLYFNNVVVSVNIENFFVKLMSKISDIFEMFMFVM